MRGTPRSPRVVTVWQLVITGALLAGCSASAASAPSPARDWALATSAVLTTRNGERHDILGGQERTDTAVAQVRDLLDRWWGVRDRDSLVRLLDWLEREGHRVPFAQLGADLGRRSPADVATMQADPGLPEDVRHQMAVVVREHHQLGAKGLLGWDYARYVSLCRWSYLVGLLSEEEAWARIMSAARRIQATFSSWQELGENYLIGREFWSPTEMRRTGHLYQDALQRLLTDPQSPWVRLPWGTSLGAPLASPASPSP